MRKALIRIFVLFFLIMSCSNITIPVYGDTLNATPTFKASKYLEYTNPNYGMKIKYPSDCPKTEEGRYVAFYFPYTSEVDVSREFIDIEIEELPSNSMTLNKYVNYSMNEIKSQFPDLKIVESVPILLDSKPAYKFIYTYTDKRKSPNPHLKTKKIWSIKGNKAYVITFLAEEGDYFYFSGAVEEMINSFRYTEIQKEQIQYFYAPDTREKFKFKTGVDFSAGYGGNIFFYNSIFSDMTIGFFPESWNYYDNYERKYIDHGIVVGLSSSLCSDRPNGYKLTRISLGYGTMWGQGMGQRGSYSLCYNEIEKAGQKEHFYSLLCDVTIYYGISMGGVIEIYQFDISSMKQINDLAFKIYMKLGFGFIGINN
ncbi:MAG: PsbP-related protein [Candidatus Margulisiibacteriota bacterium]